MTGEKTFYETININQKKKQVKTKLTKQKYMGRLF